MASRKKIHALEGKYIVFRYRECDSEDEGNCLAVYCLSRNKLDKIIVPYADMGPCELNFDVIDRENGDFISIDEFTARTLKKRGIQELISVFHHNDFFGIPYGCQELSENFNAKGELEEWCEWNSLCNDDYELDLLKEYGINVKFYDNDAKKFIE